MEIEKIAAQSASAPQAPAPPPPPAMAVAGTAAKSKGSQESPTPREALVALFEKLLGHKPSEADQARLYHVQETLGLRTNDALWLVMVALQYYHALYERFPPMIRDAAHQLLTELKTEADARTKQAALELQFAVRDLKQPLADAVQAAADTMRAQLVDASRQASEKAMRRARLEKFWPWLLAGGASVSLALVLAISVALSYGRQEGYTNGFEAASRQFRDRTTSSAPRPAPPNSSSGARGR